MNYFHASIIFISDIFHIYLINLLSCYFSQANKNNTTRILKTVEIQRPMFIPKFSTNIFKTSGQEIRLINTFALQIVLYHYPDT